MVMFMRSAVGDGRGRPPVCNMDPGAGGHPSNHVHHLDTDLSNPSLLPGAAWAEYVSAKWSQAQRTGLFLSEDEARFLFHQFITAVAFCHGKSVAHRSASHRRPGPRSRFESFGSEPADHGFRMLMRHACVPPACYIHVVTTAC